MESLWNEAGEHLRSGRKSCINTVVFTTNPTESGLGSNPDLHGQRMATNRLRQDTVSSIYLLIYLFVYLFIHLLSTYRIGNKGIRDCDTGNKFCIRKTKIQAEIWKVSLLKSGRLKDQEARMNSNVIDHKQNTFSEPEVFNILALISRQLLC